MFFAHVFAGRGGERSEPPDWEKGGETAFYPLAVSSTAMARWECAIEGDTASFDSVEDLMVHQAADHERIECKVCGAVVPDGYFAIRHAFDEHSRAEYVRAYDPTAAEIRHREKVKDRIEAKADVRAVVDRLDE